jgi:hypothetical protein
MKKLKDIVLIGFAILGFVSVLSGFTEQQVYGTPESHLWEPVVVENGGSVGGEIFYALNKVTGEARRYERLSNGGPTDRTIGVGYRTSSEIPNGIQTTDYEKSIYKDRN